MFGFWQRYEREVFAMQAQEKERQSSQEIPLSKDYLFQHKTLEERATEYGGNYITRILTVCNSRRLEMEH